MHIQAKQSGQRGFTLLEVLISVAVMSVIGTIIAQSFFTTTRSSAKVEILKDTKQSGDFAMSVMERMIRNASDITTSCASTGTTVDSISIRSTDGGVTTFQCALNGGVTRIASSSANGIVYLSATNVTLGGTVCEESSLEFVCASNPSAGKSVKIQFSLSQKGTGGNQSERASTSFQTTINVRN